MEIKTKEIHSCNLFKFEVGTTGYMGGDSGHGGQTIVKIADEGGTAWDLSILDNDSLLGLEIKLYGDTELYTFIEGLEFVLEELKSKTKKDVK